MQWIHTQPITRPTVWILALALSLAVHSGLIGLLACWQLTPPLTTAPPRLVLSLQYLPEPAEADEMAEKASPPQTPAPKAPAIDKPVNLAQAQAHPIPSDQPQARPLPTSPRPAPQPAPVAAQAPAKQPPLPTQPAPQPASPPQPPAKATPPPAPAPAHTAPSTAAQLDSVQPAQFVGPPPQAVYPLLAIRQRLQGDAVVHAQLTAKGELLNPVIHRSSGHAILDQAALEQVRRWRYQPAQRQGQPITSDIAIPVSFVLR